MLRRQTCFLIHSSTRDRQILVTPHSDLLEQPGPTVKFWAVVETLMEASKHGKKGNRLRLQQDGLKPFARTEK